MPQEALTVETFRAIMREHARELALLQRPGIGSYEQVARHIGRLTHILAFVWLILGAPGAPVIDGFIDRTFDEHGLVIILVLAVIVVPYALTTTWWWLPESIWRMFRMPLELLVDSYAALVLLTGIAIVGAVAVIPATIVLHTLGLTA